MDINYLYYFKTLAELSNYTRAAEKLHITQPSLSYAIGRLENQIGCPLFSKSGKGVVLNAYGKTYYLYVCEAIRQLEEGHRAVISQQNSEKIVVGLTKSMIHSRFPVELLEDYISAYPEWKDRMDVAYYSNSHSLAQDIQNGTISLGIGLNCDSPRLQRFLIFRRDMCAVTNRTHPLAQRDEISCQELCLYRLALYHPAISKNSSYFIQLFEKNGQPINADFFDEYVDIAYYAITHHAVAIVPRSAQLEFQPYHICTLTDYPHDMNFYMMMRADARRDGGAARFFRHCRERYSLH